MLRPSVETAQPKFDQLPRDPGWAAPSVPGTYSAGGRSRTRAHSYGTGSTPGRQRAFRSKRTRAASPGTPLLNGLFPIFVARRSEQAQGPAGNCQEASEPACPGAEEVSGAGLAQPAAQFPAASVLVFHAPSFRSRFVTWTLTVFSLMNRASPIWRSVRLSTRRSSTSASCPSSTRARGGSPGLAQPPAGPCRLRTSRSAVSGAAPRRASRSQCLRGDPGRNAPVALGVKQGVRCLEPAQGSPVLVTAVAPMPSWGRRASSRLGARR